MKRRSSDGQGVEGSDGGGAFRGRDEEHFREEMRTELRTKTFRDHILILKFFKFVDKSICKMDAKFSFKFDKIFIIIGSECEE